MKTCSFDPCENPRRPKSILCSSHKSQRERGKGLTVIPPKMTDVERFWSKVDQSAECWVWTDPLRPDGYGSLGIGGRGGKRWLAHRFSFELANGPIARGAEIDHQCLTRACVNPAHLREVSKKQNMENRSGPQRGSSSGIRGVSWSAAHGKWRAQVGHNQSNFHVGYFTSKEAAAESAMAKRLELFTHNELDRIAA